MANPEQIDREALRSALKGDPESQSNLGDMYARGEGVALDVVEAARWWRMAAEQGSVHAQTQLGLTYAEGEGVNQDYAEAASWWRKAAQQQVQSNSQSGSAPSAPAATASTASSSSDDPIGDLIDQVLANQSPDSAPTGSGADSTAVSEIVVTARRNSSDYDSGFNPDYLQFVNNTNGGRHNVSALNHFLYEPFPGLPSTMTNVLQRTLVYSSLNSSVNSPGSVYNTTFFNAASNVTGIFGLTGAQYFSILTDAVGINYPFDPTTLNNINQLGSNLYQYVNEPLFYALYNGNDNFTLQTGVTLGSVAGGSTQDLNYALVHNEQTYVQSFLDNLPAD